MRLIIIVGLVLLFPVLVHSQVKVMGRVYDMSQSIPLSAVSVLSTGGTGTITDSTGRYAIYVKETDSIWFSYLGKPTPKYPVLTIVNTLNFEVSLHVNVTELKQVTVKPPNYREDSLRNREEYARAFNYKKPGIGINLNPGGAVGLDLDQFIQMFQFGRNRRMAHFRDRLLREEEEKFIEHRFNRALVIKITQLRGAQLDTFMVRYKPNLEFTQLATDYEFRSYIKLSYEKFIRLQRVMQDLRRENE